MQDAPLAQADRYVTGGSAIAFAKEKQVARLVRIFHLAPGCELSFHLAREEYGLEVTKVQEIILLGEITRLPHTPDFIKGLINLRSTVIPVIDLRLRFGLAAEAQTDESRVMVVRVGGKTLGLIVDAVSEVLRVSAEQIVPPPPTVAGVGRDFLSGLVKLDKRLLILLNIDKILGEDETAAVEAIAASR